LKVVSVDESPHGASGYAREVCRFGDCHPCGVTHDLLQSRLAISRSTSAWQGWFRGHQQARSWPARSARIWLSVGRLVGAKFSMKWRPSFVESASRLAIAWRLSPVVSQSWYRFASSARVVDPCRASPCGIFTVNGFPHFEGLATITASGCSARHGRCRVICMRFGLTSCPQSVRLVLG